MAGVGEGGVSAFPSSIHTRAELVGVVTKVVFGGSVLHHALNSPHHLYSYAPHRPTDLHRCLVPPPSPA